MNFKLNEETIPSICSVCGQDIKVDKYKQGDCPNCGWHNSFMADRNPNKVIYQNLVSLDRAKELYQQGKSFAPTLEEFVEALFFYSEVQFEYNDKVYGVVLAGNTDTENIIEIAEIGHEPFGRFKNKSDFILNAKIGDSFLKDIWTQVKNANWLQ